MGDRQDEDDDIDIDVDEDDDIDDDEDDDDYDYSVTDKFFGSLLEEDGLRVFSVQDHIPYEYSSAANKNKVPELVTQNASEMEADDELIMQNGSLNDEVEPSEEIPEVEPLSNGDEPEKSLEGKVPTELQPPRVFEASSASGVRTLRYALEKEGFGQVVALNNDKVHPSNLVSNIARSEGKSKTTPINLPRQAIEQQFGNTMKQAAINLNVSLSALKRKIQGYGISEWQGPSLAKRKAVDSSHNQKEKNEENDGLLQNPSSANKNENTVIIKAEYAGNKIKFHLSISEAAYVNIEKEIGLQFNLTVGTYQLTYLDEDGDWIMLKSDQDMSYCIQSSRKFDRTLVQLRVQQST